MSEQLNSMVDFVSIKLPSNLSNEQRLDKGRHCVLSGGSNYFVLSPHGFPKKLCPVYCLDMSPPLGEKTKKGLFFWPSGISSVFLMSESKSQNQILKVKIKSQKPKSKSFQKVKLKS